MSTLFDLLYKGGLTMIPMVGFSIATMACAIERSWFWYRLLSRENQVVHQVLEAAQEDLEKARAIAEQSAGLPIGRFLLAPLQLHHPSPETFHLAMEGALDDEFVQMRKGDKLLETVIAVAPLLGLLGTVTGLILTFSNLNIGGGGGTEQATAAAAGIGEALITTASGMVVAIMALLVFRMLVSLQSQQMDYFTKVGTQLELIYRQRWYEPAQRQLTPSTYFQEQGNGI
jgi:biopolymer transport protein ExbB